MTLSRKFNFTVHMAIKPTAEILNRGEKTDMTRGWPQGRSPGGDIWPGGAGAEHMTKNTKKGQKNEKFLFLVVETFLELVTSRVAVRLKRAKQLLGPWGLTIHPQIAKNGQKMAKSPFLPRSGPTNERLYGIKTCIILSLYHR